VPFLARQVCLPVLFRLHIPKTSASKTEQARALVDLLAAALDGRTVHVVGDARYRGPAWRQLPAHVTFTTRLAANAVVYGPQPPRAGKVDVVGPHRVGQPDGGGQGVGPRVDDRDRAGLAVAAVDDVDRVEGDRTDRNAGGVGRLGLA